MEGNEIFKILDLADLGFGNLEKGTDVGFNKEEIQKTSTEDLLALKKTVVAYLKSKKLKKRNGNFMDVYQRINDELKERKKIVIEEKESINSGFIKAEISQGSDDRHETTPSATSEEETKPLTFINRKHSMPFDVEIPSFFNDKNFNDKKQKLMKEKTPDKRAEEDKPIMKSLKGI
jgi:hypothetical protein